MLGPKSTYQQRLLRWFYKNRRNLPWRANAPDAPDAYHVLLSELMLQQTQVATVVPYFHRFLEQLPTLADLAAADEQTVLRLWQGLGYYSRARNLRLAARAIVERHGGVVPADVASLLALPGVGRYTAGAVASIAYDTSAPILDGNVARVLCRIDAITADPRDRLTQQTLWKRAEEILPPRAVGDFNQSLMELGATVCTPRNPQCLICPVRPHCEAFEKGLADRIPPPKQRAPSPRLRRIVLIVTRGDSPAPDSPAPCVPSSPRLSPGDNPPAVATPAPSVPTSRPSDEHPSAVPTHVLLEQRPSRGRWAGLWQFPTVEADTPQHAAERLSLAVADPRPLGEVTHTLTHRHYTFAVHAARLADDPPAADLPGTDPPGNDSPGHGPAGPRRWVAVASLGDYPLSRPQLLAATLAGLLPAASSPATTARAARPRRPRAR